MSWKKVKLGELLDHFSVRAKDVGGADNLDFFGVSNEYGIIKTKYAAEEKAEDYKIIEKDCFAYNPYRINVGSIGLVIGDFKGLISPAYVVFKPKPKSIKAGLLLKFLKSSEGLRQIKFYARGTVRQALRFEDLCNIELEIPSFEEQVSLFEKLDSIQKGSNLIATELTHQLHLVQKLRQQLLQEAVQGKLVPQDPNDEPASILLQKIKAEKERLVKEKKLKKDKVVPLEIEEDEIPYQIPKSWTWCRLGELFWVTKLAGFEYTEHIKLKTSGEIPVVRAQNVKPNRLLDDNLLYIDKATSLLLDRCALVKKSLLITFIGAGIGEVAIFNKQERWHLAPNVAKAEPLFESLQIEYVMWFLLSDFGKNEFFKISKATAQPSLSMGTIREVCIPLPPLAEQHRIVQKLEHLMSLCDALEAGIRHSQSCNERLLQQVLREALRGHEA